MNVGSFIGKRLLRLGWLVLLLIVMQFFVSHATVQSGLSRTAPLPPVSQTGTVAERQSFH